MTLQYKFEDHKCYVYIKRFCKISFLYLKRLFL